MATKDDVGVWYLNADGSDAVKDFPAIQRANAEKLTATRAPSIAGFSLDKSLKKRHRQPIYDRKNGHAHCGV